MSFKLRPYKLGEITDITSSKRIKMADYVPAGIPFFRSKEIIELSKGGEISTELFITQKQFDDIEKRFGAPQKGDILLTSVGTLGVPYHVEEKQLPFYFKDGNLTWMMNFKSNVNSRYIYYWLTSQTGKRKIDEISIGTTQRAITIIALKSLEIELPEIQIQNTITQILDSICDKIALNTQINQTLEAMAQGLFKSWFVDFDPVKAKMEARASGGSDDAVRRAAMAVISGKSEEELVQFEQENPEAFGQLAATADLFPDALVESELGLIPEGWEVKTVGDVANTTDYVANGSFAALKENVTLYDEPNEILYVRTTDYNSGFSGNLKYTDRKSYEFLKKSTLFGRETIISNVGDVGTVFRAPVWLNHPMTLGSNAVAVISENHNSYLFWLFRSDYGQQLLDSIVTGSAQLKFNKTNLRSLRILWPTDKILTLYEKHEKLLHQKSISINGEIEMLKSTRDTLLPKLLSGEIDLSSFGDRGVGE